MSLLVGGIAIGAVYALVAISLTLIFRATGIVNFAQGEMLMVGGYAYVILAGSGANPAVQIAGPIAAGLVLGLLFFFVTRVLLGRAAEITVVIGTLAISILLQAAARLKFTDNPMRAVPWLFGERDIALGGGTTVSINALTVVLATVVVFAALQWLFSRTLYGKAMRAVAEDARRAAITGIPVNAMLALSWCVGGVVTAVAGVLLSPVTGVFPAMGASVLFPAFIAAALGGFESVVGALVGGLGLGIVQTYAVVGVGGAFRDVVTFAVLVAVLIWRPQGIFATVARRTH
ncbi:MAG: branched-chain amino acid ABC transporter permease [Candidatus Eremiobacteraeota bacterium]|nr:branched-chain amino acid ABC transporter permease [Candidatus Eremiobacteraeota bacterium]